MAKPNMLLGLSQRIAMTSLLIGILIGTSHTSLFAAVADFDDMTILGNFRPAVAKLADLNGFKTRQQALDTLEHLYTLTENDSIDNAVSESSGGFGMVDVVRTQETVIKIAASLAANGMSAAQI